MILINETLQNIFYVLKMYDLCYSISIDGVVYKVGAVVRQEQDGCTLNWEYGTDGISKEHLEELEDLILEKFL
jgi:hypothetical protein